MVDKVHFYILFLHENSFRSTFMIIICILKSTITIIMSLLLFKKKNYVNCQLNIQVDYYHDYISVGLCYHYENFG